MKLNTKGQLGDMQNVALGIVTTVAIVGISYAIVQGLLDSQTAGTEAHTGINAGFALLDTVKNNLGLIITIAVFTVVLGLIALFGATRA